MAKRTRRARAADPCQRIRDRVAATEERIQELVDFLPEAPPNQRKIIREIIARQRQLLRLLLAQLARCENEHRP